MTRQLKLTLTLLGLVGGAVLATFALTGPATSEDTQSPSATARRGAGVLDGLRFTSVLGPQGEPADVQDTLIFEHGMFVSTECERRCNYPAGPYFTRREGERVEFVSETRCPGKDATIVWRGSVEDGKVEGELTWTVSRWYWTVERQFWFEGTLAESSAPLASRQ